LHEIPAERGLTMKDDPGEVRGRNLDRPGGEIEPEHESPREDPFGRGFDRPEPGRPLEHRHEPLYTEPYDRWEPKDYVFYSGQGYHREFIEPYKMPGEGRYAGRGPKGYARNDARIEEDVNERLTEEPELDATEIRVRVEAGEVTIEGGVPDRASKRLAEDICWSVRGVKDTHNRLRVGAPAKRISIAPEDSRTPASTDAATPAGREESVGAGAGRKGAERREESEIEGVKRSER